MNNNTGRPTDSDFSVVEDGDGSGVTWLQRNSDGAIIGKRRGQAWGERIIWRAESVGGAIIGSVVRLDGSHDFEAVNAAMKGL